MIHASRKEKMNIPHIKPCKCGKTNKMIYLREKPSSPHTGRFTCAACGQWLRFASKEMSEFLNRLELGGDIDDDGDDT